MARGEEALMQLTINQREKQGVIILELNGRLVLGEECESFRTLIRELLAAKKKQILVGLADILRIDSTGIGAMVESVILTAKEGGRLKLFNLPRLIRNILTTHRLLQAFDIYETEDEAVASFVTESQPAAS
jgi:anti-sigma B factor antagonist